MKKTRLILAAALMACAGLFSGCSKDLGNTPIGDGASNSRPVVPTKHPNDGVGGLAPSIKTPNDVYIPPPPAQRGMIHYQFTTLPQVSTNPMQWTAGSLYAKQLLFNGNFVMTTATTPLSIDSLINQVISLGTMANLGFLRPNVGTYRDIVFLVKMGVTTTTNSIVMVGTYNAGGVLYPVRLIVNQDLFVQGQWPPDTKIVVASAHEYTALLQMDLDKLTENSGDLFKQAIDNTTPGSELLITSETNTQLFQLIYQHLIDKNALLVRFN